MTFSAEGNIPMWTRQVELSDGKRALCSSVGYYPVRPAASQKMLMRSKLKIKHVSLAVPHRVQTQALWDSRLRKFLSFQKLLQTPQTEFYKRLCVHNCGFAFNKVSNCLCMNDVACLLLALPHGDTWLQTHSSTLLDRNPAAHRKKTNKTKTIFLSGLIKYERGGAAVSSCRGVIKVKMSGEIDSCVQGGVCMFVPTGGGSGGGLTQKNPTLRFPGV